MSLSSFATMTVRQWEEATPAQRLNYRMVRHPLTVLFGYFTIFMLDMCLMSFLRSPRKRWDSLIGLVATLAPIVGRWPILVQAPYYLIMGTVWIIPLKPLIRWSQSGHFRAPRE